MTGAEHWHRQMKLILALIATLWVVGCHRQPDAEIRKCLPGTWSVSGTNVNGDQFWSTIKVEPSGNYACQFIAGSRWDGVVRTSNIAGKFEVHNGALIDTVTNHSNTNTGLPWRSRARVIRSNRGELAIKYEASDRGEFPTNEVVLRKEEK